MPSQDFLILVSKIMTKKQKKNRQKTLLTKAKISAESKDSKKKTRLKISNFSKSWSKNLVSLEY